MIYITGDCHQDFERFNIDVFPEQKEMTKDDCVIICGDFGFVWDDGFSDGWRTDHLQHYLWMGITRILTGFMLIRSKNGTGARFTRYGRPSFI